MDLVRDSVLRQFFNKGLKASIGRRYSLASDHKHMPDAAFIIHDLLIGFFQDPDLVPVDHRPFIGTCHFCLQICFCTL